MSTLIKGATLPDGATTDVLVADGVIAEIGSVSTKAERTIGADGLPKGLAILLAIVTIPF